MTEKEQIGQEEQGELESPRWAVITFDSIVAHHLTYEEALHWTKKLEQQMQNGICIVTDEAAERMQNQLLQKS